VSTKTATRASTGTAANTARKAGTQTAAPAAASVTVKTAVRRETKAATGSDTKALAPARAANRPAPVSEPRIAVYVRIASVLKTRIVRGELALGDRVPGIEELCSQYGVARATARQVLQLLVSEGLISSERGRGSHVVYQRPPLQQQPDGMFQMIGPTPADHGIKVIRRRRCTTLPVEFGVEAGSSAPEYVHITKVHARAGQPYGVFETYVDARLHAQFPRGSDAREKIFVLMQRHAAVPGLHGHENLTVHPADWDEARQLHYQVGMPVAHIVRIMRDRRGTVVYAASNAYRGDAFRQDRTITGYFYRGDGAVVRETSEATSAR